MTVTEIKVYDPSPGDGKENDDRLTNLIDGKDSTTWSTELYKSAAFGNLKEGVGLDFTLSEPATIMEIVSTVDGWGGELRQATSSGLGGDHRQTRRQHAEAAPARAHRGAGASGSPNWWSSPTAASAWSCRRSRFYK